MAEAQYPYPDIERHPLQPFLPPNAQILMLGSFPPPKERWCMDFFYPNPQNDMWRIMGQIFFGDKTYFEGQRDSPPDGSCHRGLRTRQQPQDHPCLLLRPSRPHPHRRIPRYPGVNGQIPLYAIKCFWRCNLLRICVSYQ